MTTNTQKSANERKVIKELLERTGKTFTIESISDLRKITLDIEATEGFRGKARLMAKGESSEVLLNLVSILKDVEETPNDAIINSQLLELGKAMLPDLEGQLQAINQRISFYTQMSNGEIDMEALRNYLDDNSGATPKSTPNLKAMLAEEAEAVKGQKWDDTSSTSEGSNSGSVGISADFRKKD